MIGLIVFLLVQIVFILYLNKLRVKSEVKLTLNRIAILSSIFTYLTIIVYVIYLKLKYQDALDSFDINKDGFFTGDEINEAQIKAMKNVTNDTGRNFAPISGIAFSVIYYIFLLPILIIIDKINSKLKATQSFRILEKK